MVLLCGIPSETPLAMVKEELEKLDIAYVLFNQRDFKDITLYYQIDNGEISGELQIKDQLYRLEHFQGIYTRLMDYNSLPEFKSEPKNSSARTECRLLHETLMHWSEISSARVVNKIIPMGSNSSKPYQAQLLLEQGLKVPDTLITNQPELVLEFKKKHKKIIYKSISGVRSIVQQFKDDDIKRLKNIYLCPTQFQEFVEGTDVRVHVVGKKVFATAILADTTDYRYAKKEGKTSELKAIDLPEELSQKCIQLSEALKLPFSGIDLKITSDDEVYCFEVNPSPGYSYYEANTGQQIAKAVAEYLMGK